jgi:type VI secretion system protein ImpC
LTAAGPELMNLDSYTNLGTPRDIAKIFDSTEFAKWKSFRESEDARYVGLALPHILMRLPYGRDTKPVDGFNYEEAVDGTDHSKYLWGNAAYALGTRLTNAFAQYSWCAAIRGVEGGGLVEGLPAHTFRTDEGDVALKCPTEIAITDRREKELADNGFIPLVHCKGTDYAAFFSVQSAQKPKVYNKDAANANARLSTQLPYILAVSRFAHYLKAMMRDKIGSFMSRSQAERFLNDWIQTYTIGDDDAPAQIKARNPLREARVEVVEVPGKPGAYRAVAFLRPHYQLDELSVSLRLVAELPPPVR